jgi:hypothetical protein
MIFDSASQEFFQSARRFFTPMSSGVARPPQKDEQVLKKACVAREAAPPLSALASLQRLQVFSA